MTAVTEKQNFKTKYKLKTEKYREMMNGLISKHYFKFNISLYPKQNLSSHFPGSKGADLSPIV